MTQSFKSLSKPVMAYVIYHDVIREKCKQKIQVIYAFKRMLRFNI